MDNNSNKLTWTVIIIIISCVAVIGLAFVNFMPAQADNIQTYITKVIVNFENHMQLDNDGNYVYIDDPASKTSTIRSYHGSSTTPTVPKYHTFGGVTYKTTAIGNNAMQGIDTEDGTGTSPEYASKYKNLTSVTLPSTIETIGNNAFQYNYLTGTLVIPSSVTKIDDMAFRSNMLTAVTIDNSKDGITFGSSVFAKNSWDEDVEITPTYTN